MLAFAFENPYFQSDCKDTVFPLKVKKEFSHFFQAGRKKGEEATEGQKSELLCIT